jgi:dTDP-4-amino-4,6-dideoxygalactose transaminase
MYHLRLCDDISSHRDDILNKLAKVGIGSRPGFVSYTLQSFCPKEIAYKYPCPVADGVSYSTFYLPSSHDIDAVSQRRVVSELSSILDSY